MDHEKMGQFIAERRKASHMTQKELAGRLNITDKAVSKWERGLSCPDIALLGSLARELGVTTGELLAGERQEDVDETVLPQVEASVDHALQYADHTAQSRVKFWRDICAWGFTAVLAVAAVICAICDVTLTGRFTWSLYCFSSMAFAWAVLFPVLKFGVNGIVGSLAALTVLMIPFLYVLGRLTGTGELMMAIGVPTSLVCLVYLWGIFVAFKIWRHRLMLVGAVFLLMEVPVELVVNWTVARVLAEPQVIEVWDILTMVLVAGMGLLLLVLDIRRHGLSNLCRKREEPRI